MTRALQKIPAEKWTARRKDDVPLPPDQKPPAPVEEPPDGPVQTPDAPVREPGPSPERRL